MKTRPLLFVGDPTPEEVHAGVALRRDGALAEVVLSRPERRNAIDLETWERLHVVFDAIAAEPTIAVVVLRGAGGHVSAGSDISQFPQTRSGMAAAERYNRAIAAALAALSEIPQPSVAMIAGLAVGGGCELACACDLRVAADDARLGVPIARLGVSVGPEEARVMLRVLSPARVKELLLTGRILDANEAHRIGLVDRVVPRDELPSATRALVELIVAGAPLTAAANKLAVNAAWDGTIERDAARIRELETAIYDGVDLQEGIRAFLEKRDPVFRQRPPTPGAGAR
jgi:enoyl-CoA hydratase